MDNTAHLRLQNSVEKQALGGAGMTVFEIIDVNVDCGFKDDVTQESRYDHDNCGEPQAILRIKVRRDTWSFIMRVMTVTEFLMVLEVTSFLCTESTDLAGRFSISGTNFLAMVSLYYPTHPSQLESIDGIYTISCYYLPRTLKMCWPNS